MAPVAAQLQDGHIPLLHIGIDLRFIGRWKRSPVLWSQFQRLIDDAVRHGDAQRRASRLDLVFAPLQQNLIVALDALLLLLFWRDEPDVIEYQPGRGTGCSAGVWAFRAEAPSWNT
ncbi:hypothetical protein EYF80_008330 [Liparis tanakae]|uniref:Uncharacterized protein n=1 Tax=Liparis tanakae TaxID=230148 RepID=A0A4Z2IUZ1_9TELE|nr:hypothetical protein EYF80_008330 [Liparis tanakae]